MMKHIRLFSALTLCALLLTACGGNQNTASNSNTQTNTQPNSETQTSETTAAPDTSNDTFSVELFTGLLDIGKSGLVEQMGTGTEIRDDDDNHLEGYRYEGVMFGQNAIAEVDLDDNGTVDDVDIYFTGFSVSELKSAVGTPNIPYKLECESTPNGSVLEIGRD